MPVNDEAAFKEMLQVSKPGKLTPFFSIHFSVHSRVLKCTSNQEAWVEVLETLD